MLDDEFPTSPADRIHVGQAERGLDAYRQQLQDRFEQKLEHVQRSVDEIQAAAGQKNTVVADLEAKKNAMEKELAATKAKIPGLESEIRKLEESNFDFKDRWFPPTERKLTSAAASFLYLTIGDFVLWCLFCFLLHCKAMPICSEVTVGMG